MNRFLKRFLIFLISIGILSSIVIFYILDNKTYYNEDGTTGNTAGNLYNGGLFCEIGDWIYYSNLNDDGALYRMHTDCSDIQKIKDDKVCYINGDEHYIYYSRINYAKQNPVQSIITLYNRGIYRIDHDGEHLTMLYQDPSGLLSLYGNYIYYQHYNTKTGTTFYRVKINGEEEKKISDEPLIPASYYNNQLYYANINSTHDLHTMDMNTLTDQVFLEGNYYMPIVTQKGIYYIDAANHNALCFLEHNAKKPVVLVNEFCSFYNLDEKNNILYVQIDASDNNRLCRLNLIDGSLDTLQEGNYKQIHVTSRYMFFVDFNETNVYAYEPSSKMLNIFHSSVEK